MINIFSSGLPRKTAEYLLNIPEFQPIYTLVTQLDRKSIEEMIEYIHMGVVKSLFVDSGAFSHHTRGVPIDVDDYISYVNSIDEYVTVIAQVDKIPGVFGKHKTPQDYIDSAKESWDNFLYMYYKLKSPRKLIPVFHYGEPFEYLGKMLDFVDDKGNKLEYVGIGPAKDSSTQIRDVYLSDVFQYIRKSSNPNVKVHLFGMTSLSAFRKFGGYSGDSISHIMRCGNGSVFTRKWGVVKCSYDRVTSVRNKSIIKLGDDKTLNELLDLVKHYGGESLEQLATDREFRLAVDIMETSKEVSDIQGHTQKFNKKLF